MCGKTCMIEKETSGKTTVFPLVSFLYLLPISTGQHIGCWNPRRAHAPLMKQQIHTAAAGAHIARPFRGNRSGWPRGGMSKAKAVKGQPI